MSAQHGALGLAVIALVATLLVACGREKRETVRQPTASSPMSMPSANSTSRPATLSPTATASPEQAVLAAYERYWSVYSAALLDLDATPVQSVAAEAEFERIRQEINELHAQGVALRVNVKRNPIVVEVKDESAVIFDEVINNSFYVDAKTKQPPQASGSGEVLQDTYHFKRIDGTWKVVLSTRQR